MNHFSRFTSRPVIWYCGRNLRPGCYWSASCLTTHTHHQQVTVQKRTYYTPLAPPPLFDLCVQRSFGEALERARTHPHEAKFKHPRNWTALHCCVEHVAPLELVKAIYEANPQALTIQDWQGFTPEEAAVDMETKAFLSQQASLLQQKSDPNTTNSHMSSSTTSESDHGGTSDPILVGKLLFHTEQLSDQVTELNKTAQSLEQEIKQLKETLKTLTTK